MDTTPLVMAATLVPIIALGLCASAGLAIFFAMRRGVAPGRHGLRRVVLLAGGVFALLPWEGAWASTPGDWEPLFPAWRVEFPAWKAKVRASAQAKAKVDARLWVDEVIRRIEEKNGSITQEEAATALYNKLVREFKFMLDWLPEMTGDALIPIIANCDEIVRRFGQDDRSAIRIIVLKTLIKKMEILRTFHHLSGTGSLTITEAFDEIDRRLWQDNNPTIQTLYIESLIVRYGALPLRERSKYAEAIYELDKKLQLLPQQRDNYTAAKEAVVAVAVAAVYDAIGQRFGAASDYAVALYLTERGMYLCWDGYYRAAIVFLDEVERRFNEDERPEIRPLVHRAIKMRASFHKLYISQ